MTHLCVAIFVNDGAKAHREIAQAAEAGAEMVELRIDRFTDIQALDQILHKAVVPCILTCRPTWEGGQNDLSDTERLHLLREASAMATPYVDLELETIKRSHDEIPHRSIIASSHDFTGRPARLNNILVELNQSIGHIVKIVWQARTIRDNLEAFEILKIGHKPTIALCMGEAGLISRVLAKKFGGFLTFASLETGGGTAPGQISVSDMKNLYRWDAINDNTKVYGVVAHPVMHSMSPAIHNAAFTAINHDGVYLPMLVEPGYESFKAFMESFLNFDGLDLSGLSVTLPHKENALRYLKEKGAEIEPLAQTIGAVNTIIITPAAPSARTQSGGPQCGPYKTLKGMNTDYAAILDSITTKLKITREDLANYRVAVLGAGGTGRTAVAALAHYGATVVVYNRTKKKADALAAEFNDRTGQVVSARLEKLCDSCCHIFINTTSVGMSPKIDESPLGDCPPKFTPDTLVFDTIYNPMKTKLLTQAEQAGAKTIGGVEMFVRQAAAQFETWTGKKAPMELMKQVVERRLAK
jgi:3-dehydroquinate dehydratase/shikimate dehydrogenase